jgi:hypothetical protein
MTSRGVALQNFCRFKSVTLMWYRRILTTGYKLKRFLSLRFTVLMFSQIYYRQKGDEVATFRWTRVEREHSGITSVKLG